MKRCRIYAFRDGSELRVQGDKEPSQRVLEALHTLAVAASRATTRNGDHVETQADADHDAREHAADHDEVGGL